MAIKDERVVELRFDNSDFERNAKTSMNTLDKLEGKLDFQAGQKGVRLLEGALNNLANVDLSQLSNALDTVSYRFSTIGVIGQTIVSNLTSAITGKLAELGSGITAVFNQIEEGGKRRATNFEQARFMLGGLIDKAEGGAKRVQEILDGPVSKAVKNTRFGLDEAAVAASNLYASGITDDTELGKSLKAISGAAAMTNREYSDMAQIFATVKSNGKLMTMQLRQFSAMGMNVSAKLAKDLGKSEEQINQMVTDGKISYEQFADSMVSYFKQAKKANTTFSGALANTKAALSRIGEKTEAFKLERYRKVLTDCIPVLDAIKDQLTPVFAILNGGTQAWTHFARVILQNHDLLVATHKVINGLIKIFKGFKSIVSNFTKNFEDFFDIDVVDTLVTMADKFKEFARAFKTLTEGAKSQTKMTNLFRGLFTSIQLVMTLFKGLQMAFAPVTNFITNTGKLAIRVLDAIISDLTVFMNGLMQSGDLNKVFGSINQFFRGFIPNSTDFANFGDSLIAKIHEIIPTYSEFKAKMLDAKTAIYEFFNMDINMSILDNIKQKFTDFFGLDPDWSLLDKLKEGFSSISGVTEELGEHLQSVWEFIKGLLNGVKSFVSDFFGTIKMVVQGIFDFISGLFEGLQPVFEKIGDCIDSFFGKHPINQMFASMNLLAFLGAILDFLDTMGHIAKDVRNMSGLSTTMKIFISDMNKQLTRLTDIETLKAFAVAVALLAGSLFVLSLVDPQRLAAATGAILFLMVALERVMTTMTASGVFSQAVGVGSAKTSVIGRMGIQFITLAAAIFILASAVKKLASLNPDALLIGLGAMIVIMAALIGMFKAMDALFSDPKAANTLISISEAMLIMAVAIRIMASAVKAFSKIDPEKGLKGLGLMALAIAEIVVALLALERLSTDAKSLVVAAGAIFIVASALTSIAIALSIMSLMDQEKLGTSLTFMALALASIVTALLALERISFNPNDLLLAAGSIFIVATALTSIAVALSLMSLTNQEKLGTSLLFMGLALGAITAALLALVNISLDPKELLLAAGSIFIVANALVAISAALMLLTVCDPVKLAVAVASLAVTLAVVSGALFLLTAADLNPAKLLVSAAAIAILSVAMIALATALATLSLIPGDRVASSLILMAGGLAILMGAALVATAVLPGLIALAAGIAIIGAGFLLFSMGLSTLATALFQLALVDYKKIGPGMLEVGLALASIVGPGLKALPAALGIALLSTALIALVGTISLLTTMSGKDIEKAFAKINSLMAFISSFIDKLIFMLASKAVMFATITVRTVLTILRVLGEYAGPIAEAGVDLFVNLLQGFASGVSKRAGDIRQAILDIIDAMVKVLTGQESLSDFMGAAHDLIDGFIKGIKDKVGDAVNSIKSFGTSVVNGLKDILGIASPSKVMRELGEFSGEGFVIGVRYLTSEVKRAGEDLGSALVAGIHASAGKGEVYRSYVHNASKQVKKFIKANKLAQYSHLANKLYFKSDDYKKNIEDLQNYYREYNKQYKQTQKSLAEYRKGGKDEKSKKTTYENDLEKLKELDKEGKQIAKTIAKGPQTALKNFRKELKNTVKEFLSFSNLNWNKIFDGFDKIEKANNLGNSQTIIEGLSGSLRELADSAKATSDQFDLLNTGSGTGINLLERFGKVSSMTVRRLMTNAKSQLKAYEEFQNGIQQMYRMGFSTELINTMKAQGPEALNYIRGFLKFNQKEVSEYNAMIDKQHEYETEQLKENMEQKVSTYEEYMEDIEELAAKGLSDGIIKRLEEAGVEQATFVKALLRMNDGDISRVNELYEKSIDAMNETAGIRDDTNETFASFNDLLNHQVSEKWAWKNMLAQLKDKGLNDELILTFKKMGSDSAKAYVEQILKETPEGIAAINANYAKLLDAEDSPGEVWLKNMKTSRRTYLNYQQNLEKMADMLPQGENSELYKKIKSMGVEDGAEYAEAFVNSSETVRDRIVREFNKQQKINAEQLQDELAEKIRSMKQWSDDLNYLANLKYTKGSKKGQRIIGEEFMDELIAMGPEAAEKIHAMTEMSRTEIRDLAVMYDDGVKEVAGKVTNSVTNSYAAVAGDGVKAFKNKVASGETKEEVVTDIKKAGNAVTKEVKPHAKQKGEAVGKATLEGVKEYVSSAKGNKVATQMVQGMAKGFDENTSMLKKAARKLARAAYNAMRDELDEHSPSRKTEEVGKYFVMGFRNGIEDNADLAVNPITDMTDKIQEAFSEVVNSIQNGGLTGLDVGINFVPNNAPYVDFSSNVAQAQQIMDIFSNLSGLNLELGRDANKDVVNAINDMRSDFQGQFDGLAATIQDLQLVMDSGALVGQIVNPMNAALGERIALAQRGVTA